MDFRGKTTSECVKCATNHARHHESRGRWSYCTTSIFFRRARVPLYSRVASLLLGARLFVRIYPCCCDLAWKNSPPEMLRLLCYYEYRCCFVVAAAAAVKCWRLGLKPLAFLRFSLETSFPFLSSRGVAIMSYCCSTCVHAIYCRCRLPVRITCMCSSMIPGMYIQQQ